jgi:hypothetical protein
METANQNTLSLEQNQQWRRLENIFKQSKFYHSITQTKKFVVWHYGAGGGFIQYTFNNDNNSKIIAKNRYESQAPPLNQDYDVQVICNLSNTKLTEHIDTKIYKILSSSNIIADHVLPIVPSFYFNNMSKIQLLIINANQHDFYCKSLYCHKMYHKHNKNNLPLDRDYNVLFNQLSLNKQQLITTIYQEIKELDTDNDYIMPIIFYRLFWIIFYDDNITKDSLIRNIVQKIHEDILMKPVTIDPISSSPDSGMMNHINPCIINYEHLMFKQDENEINKLKQFFNCNKSLNDLQKIILEYHNKNQKIYQNVKYQWKSFASKLIKLVI